MLCLQDSCCAELDMAIPSSHGLSEPGSRRSTTPEFCTLETQRILAQGICGLQKLIFEERLQGLQMYSIFLWLQHLNSQWQYFAEVIRFSLQIKQLFFLGNPVWFDAQCAAHQLVLAPFSPGQLCGKRLEMEVRSCIIWGFDVGSKRYWKCWGLCIDFPELS